MRGRLEENFGCEMDLGGSEGILTAQEKILTAQKRFWSFESDFGGANYRIQYIEILQTEDLPSRKKFCRLGSGLVALKEV